MESVTRSRYPPSPGSTAQFQQQLRRSAPGRPAVEAIAGWSARHRKAAVFGWLALVAVFLTGYSVFSGMAIGAITGVGIAVPGSLTVLPALLSMLGDRVRQGPHPAHRPQGRPAIPAGMFGALTSLGRRRPPASRAGPQTRGAPHVRCSRCRGPARSREMTHPGRCDVARLRGGRWVSEAKTLAQGATASAEPDPDRGGIRG